MQLIVLLAAFQSLLCGVTATRGRIVNPAYKAAQENDDLEETTDPPAPWIKTLADGKKSIVTPAVIASVTFYAEPTKTHDGMEPWISLKKDGSPATIRPQVKNGITKNGQPTYSTYFASPTTIFHDHNDLVAHDLKPGEVFTEVKWINDEDTEHEFDPLMRCTPEFYHDKGMGRDLNSEPFCHPHDELELKLDNTYFVTWYSRFFDPSVEKVKLHLSYVKQAALRKGFKRELPSSRGELESDSLSSLVTNDLVHQGDAQVDSALNKRSMELEKGGVVSGASFFESDWLSNNKGWVSLTIQDSFFPQDSYMEKIALSLQPDNVSDEDFDRLKNTIVVGITKRSRVSKGSMLDLKKAPEKAFGEQDEVEMYEGINYEAYIVMMTLPFCVCLVGLLMYIFIFANRNMTDLSHLKRHRVARRMMGAHKARHGDELPRYFSGKGD